MAVKVWAIWAVCWEEMAEMVDLVSDLFTRGKERTERHVKQLRYPK